MSNTYLSSQDLWSQSNNWMKTTSVSASYQEGVHSTRGTSCLLEDRKYIHYNHYMSYLNRVTCSWLIFSCYIYGMDDSNTYARPTSRIYLKPNISPNSPSLIINSVSIASMANRQPPHTRWQHLENQVDSICSTRTSMALCHISLEWCRLIQSEPTAMACYGRKSVQSKVVFEPIMEENNKS